jgi:hypothetical protein
MFFFFDSWGDLHVTCSSSDPSAAAFGPTGVSRRASPQEVGLEVMEGESAYTAALRLGRVVEPDEEGGWAILA